MSFGASYQITNKARGNGGEGDFGLFSHPPPEYPPANMVPFPYRDAI